MNNEIISSSVNFPLLCLTTNFLFYLPDHPMRPLLTDSRAFGVVASAVVAEPEAAALAVALPGVAVVLVVPVADSVAAEQRGFLVVAAVG